MLDPRDASVEGELIFKGNGVAHRERDKTA
jgi:hypothetical protein